MTQVLPSDDDFDQGTAGSYGANVNLWTRVAAWTSDPGYASGGTDFAVVFDTEGHLFDGYSAIRSSLPTAPLLVGGSAPASPSASFTRSTGGFPDLSGAMFRNFQSEDMDVRASFYIFHNFDITTSTLAGGAVRHFGIGARVQGGTLQSSDDQDAERLEDVDGYFFLRLADKQAPNAGYKYVLLRCNAGVITRLDEDPSGLNSTYAYSGIEVPISPHRMRLFVEQSAGNVSLVGYVGGATPSSWIAVVSATDSSGSKITGAGRAMLCMSPEHYVSAGENFAHCCAWFEAYDGTPTLYVRDEWSRHLPLAALEIENEGHPTVDRQGNSLMSAFSGDLYGNDVVGISATPTFAKLLDYSAGELDSDPAEFPAGFAVQDGALAFVSSRPANSATSQDRSISATWLATGSNPSTPRQAGVFVRESGSKPQDGPAYQLANGYLFVLERDDTTPANSRARLYRVWTSIGGVVNYTEIGRVGATVNESQQYVLRIVATNVAASLSDTPEIKCYVDGVQAVLADPGTTPAGVTWLSAGTVQDASSLRLVEGYGEGFYVENNPNGTKHMSFDDWTDGTTGSTAESDQATYSLAGETDGATGTLTLPGDWPVEEVSVFATLRHRYESDHVRTSPRWPRARRTWRVQSQAITEADRDALLTFWHAHDGCAVPFSWTPPGEASAITAHFFDDSLGTALRAPGVHRFDVLIEELF